MLHAHNNKIQKEFAGMVVEFFVKDGIMSYTIVKQPRNYTQKHMEFLARIEQVIYEMNNLGGE
jgi:hypothetical protein